MNIKSIQKRNWRGYPSPRALPMLPSSWIESTRFPRVKWVADTPMLRGMKPHSLPEETSSLFSHEAVRPWARFFAVLGG